jgi:choline-sulfatase
VERYPLEAIAIPPNFLPEYPFQIGSNKIRDEQLAPFPRTEYSVKVNRQEYYAIITHLDAQIGRILDALRRSGMWDNTYIFFTADHGLAVGQHGLMGKQNMFDHSVRVPFVVVGPGVATGRSNPTPIYLQDLMPTTLELAGAEVPDHVQFHSRLGIISDMREPATKNLSARGGGPAIYGAYMQSQRMVTQDAKKLILYPRIRQALLFDLATDPLEIRNLASDAENQPLMRELFERLVQLQQETGDQLDLRTLYPALAG